MAELESSQMDAVSRDSLPSGAQRWLDSALPRDLVLPPTVRIAQEGSMHVRERWTPFTATGIYQASPLSFNWRAKLQMMPGVWIAAEDGHGDGQGWGGARLWGFVPMGKRTDSKVLTSQLVRNLGELAFLPSFVPANPTLSWRGAGENAFEVQSSAGDQEVLVRFEINDQDDLIRASAPSRPYDVPGGYAEAPWRIEYSDHRNFGGVRIPTVAVATFEKEDGPWEYFRGKINAISFGESKS